MDPQIASGFEALEQHDPDRALSAALEYLETHEADASALELCARAHAQRNEPARMAEVLARLLRAHPGSVWAYETLADMFVNHRRLDKAEVLLRQALRYCPEAAGIHVRMGVVLSEKNRFVAGEWQFRRALELDDSDVAALSGLARSLIEQGRVDDADAVYRDACRRAPHDATLRAHWARLAELRGEPALAGERLAAAEAAAPGQFTLLRAGLLAGQGDIEGALATIGDSTDMNGDALLERGRLRERAGRHAEAWGDYVAGNAALRKTVPSYDRDAVERFFAALEETFTARTIATLPVAARRPDVAQPLFIVGAPRSGTTLIEQVLGSHSAIRPGGELPFIGDLRELSEKLVPYGAFPGNLAWTGTGDLRHVGTMFRDYYFARAGECGLSVDAVYFTDKMPWNELYLPLIRMAFPDAPVIALSRHPLDVLVSMFANKLNHGFHCAYSVDDIVHHLSLMERLHGFYQSQMEPRVLEVCYESFVDDHERETERILAYLGLKPEQACLDFHETRRYAATPSYRDVARPVSPRAIGRHRHFAAQLAPHVGPLKALLAAYDRSSGAVGQ